MLTDRAATSKDKRATRTPMQHRHFATIASILRTLPDELHNQRPAIAAHFAKELAATNPAFDRARFEAACQD